MSNLAEITKLADEAKSMEREFCALNERVEYLHVAVMRGDPRFAKAEYANPDFDCDAFDNEWRKRGKRVPEESEIF